MTSLRIVIVNWNAGPQLRACLESIVGADTGGFTLEQVVVVDNASTDGSLDGLESLALPLTVLRNGENRGFGAACNQGARGSRADCLLFLNPDVRLYADSLRQPMEFLDRPESRDVGIVGIPLVDQAGAVHRSCARFPTPGMFLARAVGLDRLCPGRFRSHFMTDWPHDGDRDVDHVIGAFLLIRRPVFEAACGFDERFFVYLEDLDLSLRVHRAGLRTVFFTGARAFHRGGGTSDRVKAARLCYSLHSRILYADKHFSRPAALGLRLATLFLEPVARLALALPGRSEASPRETVQGYRLLWRALAAPSAPSQT